MEDPKSIPSYPPVSHRQKIHSFYSSSIYGAFTMSYGFPGGLDGKEFACNAGDPGSIPGLGSSPGEGNGNTLQYSCLENSMDRGACLATAHGVAKSQTRLSD